MFHETYSRIEHATQHFARIKESLQAAHPEWPVGDSRTALFGKCTTALGAAAVYRILFERNVTRRDFWGSHLSQSQIEARIMHADSLLLLGTLHACFSAIESSLRLMLRAIDPAAGNGGLAEFKSIYAALFARTGLTSYEPHMDLLRLIRNVVHNNGVFLTRGGGDEQVVVDGVTYLFRQGSHVDTRAWSVSDGWSLFLPHLLSVGEKLQNVVCHPLVSTVASIPDPAAGSFA